MHTLGFPRNLGDPVSSAQNCGVVEPPTSIGPCKAALGRASDQTIKRSAVPEGEGNEARRDGWPGVGALHVTDELGEPAPGDPKEGRERRNMELLEGKMGGGFVNLIWPTLILSFGSPLCCHRPQENFATPPLAFVNLLTF